MSGNLSPDKLITIGLIINPLAGIGGPAALKGSDGVEVYNLATEMGYQSKVVERVFRAFEVLLMIEQSFRLLTVSGVMGETCCQKVAELHQGFEYEICFETGASDSVTDPSHTIAAVQQMIVDDVDLILFAGGDGTARNIHDALETNFQQLVLGIPCGVKMHSGVFAVTPEAAGMVLRQLIEGELVSVAAREVRDIDEASLRSGRVNSKYYGEMWVPEQHQYIQAVKQGGLEVEALVLEEIASGVVDRMEPNEIYIVGAGTTTASIMAKLELPNTLLGIDVIERGQVVLTDVTEAQLFQFLSEKKTSVGGHISNLKLLLTPIGGQGHLFGRGNQQLSARVVRLIGRDGLLVMATKSKLESLSQNLIVSGGDAKTSADEYKGIRLLVDTGSLSLDKSLCGLISVLTGYEDAVVCRLALD